MEPTRVAVQLAIALGIFNVWIVRYGQATQWRGGDAQNMQQEFKFYGLSDRFRFLIGITKVSLAVLLIVGVWIPVVAAAAGAVMAVLMLGAVAMHVRVSDPLQKSAPAFGMMLLSVAVVVMNL